jgi:FixJ family two-component response regulator
MSIVRKNKWHTGKISMTTRKSTKTASYLTNATSGMEEALEQVVQHDRRAERDATRLDRLHHGVDHVRRRLEDVRKQVVEQMLQRILATETGDAQRCASAAAIVGLLVKQRISERKKIRVSK